MRLPTFKELCPNGKGGAPYGGKTADKEMWTPIVAQDNGNEWVQIGGRAGGTCNPLSTYHGSTGSWMESRDMKPYKGTYGCAAGIPPTPQSITLQSTLFYSTAVKCTYLV